MHNYLNTDNTFQNTAWVTSEESGNKYNANISSSPFKTDITGNNRWTWAQDLSGVNETEQTLGEILALNQFTGYGYIKSSVSQSFMSSTSLSLQKSALGDLDNGQWRYVNEKARATARKTDREYDDKNSYARFKLKVPNTNPTLKIVNPTVLDSIPRTDDSDLLGKRNSMWNTLFRKIESIELVGADGTAEEIKKNEYDIWYYTGSTSLNSHKNEPLRQTVIAGIGEKPELLGDEWIAESAMEDADWDKVRAFLIQFRSLVIGPNESLEVTYLTVPEAMEQDEYYRKGNTTARNAFSIGYSQMSSQETNINNAIRNKTTLTSNRVEVICEPEKASVGGMVWIDADGDGIQEAEDVVVGDTPAIDKIRTASWANAYRTERENYYKDYAVVDQLIDSVTMTLQPYSGLTQKGPQAWRFPDQGNSIFKFDNLSTATLSTYQLNMGKLEDFNDGGIIISKLTGSESAYTYRLEAVINGVPGVKYRVTKPRMSEKEENTPAAKVRSYEPDAIYADTKDDLNAILAGYWENLSPEAKANYNNGDSERFRELEFKRHRDILLDNNFGTDDTTLKKGEETAITDGRTEVRTGRFYLHVSDEYDGSKDLGLTIFRDLEVNKTDENGKPVAGAKFAVYGPYDAGEASSVTELKDDKKVAELTTDSEGKVTFEDLLYFKEYLIKETEAADGYSLDTAVLQRGDTNLEGHKKLPQTWVLKIPTQEDFQNQPTAFNTVTKDVAKITNEMATGNLEFKKLENIITATGGNAERPVSGAIFTLKNTAITITGAWKTWAAGLAALNPNDPADKAKLDQMGISDVKLTTEEKETDGVTTTEMMLSFETSFENQPSESAGKVKLENLPCGTYVLTETTPAPGYGLPETKEWSVTIKNSETTCVDNAEGKIFNIYIPEGYLTLKGNKIEEKYSSDHTYTLQLYEAEVEKTGEGTSETWTAKTDVIAQAVVGGNNTTVQTAVLNGRDAEADDFTETYTIRYDKAGTYYYIVRELEPADQSGSAFKVTYDKAEYHVTVNVTDSEAHDGHLIAEVAQIQKVTKSTDPAAETTETLETSTMKDDHGVIVMPFTNTYEADGTVTIPINKALLYNGELYSEWIKSGVDDVTFEFILSQGLTEVEKIPITGKELADAAKEPDPKRVIKSFEPLKYTIDHIGKTYPYTVREVQRNAQGIVCDTKTYNIQITPKDDVTDNKLEFDITVDGKTVTGTYEGEETNKITLPNETFQFDNRYVPEGSYTLAVKKEVPGVTEIPENKFAVQLLKLKTDADGNPYEETLQIDPDDQNAGTVTSWAIEDAAEPQQIGKDGTAQFTPYSKTNSSGFKGLNFSSAGTYWYLVKEVINDSITPNNGIYNDGQYTYDTTEYFVKLTVEDKHDGTLEVKEIEVHKESPTGEVVTSAAGQTGIVFTNLTTVQYTVAKQWKVQTEGSDSQDAALNMSTQPESVWVRLQRRTDDSAEWQNMKPDVELSNENGWAYTWPTLEKFVRATAGNADEGKVYQYRAVEVDQKDGTILGEDPSPKALSGNYGTKYEVTNPDDFIPTEVGAAGESGSGIITNTLQTGGLKVTKDVTGKGDQNKDFEFSVQFMLVDNSAAIKDTKPVGTYQYSTDDGNTWTDFTPTESNYQVFTLKHGKTIEFKGLPVGAQYIITETKVDGYKTTVDNISGETNEAKGLIQEETSVTTRTFHNYYAEGSLTLKGTKKVSGLSDVPEGERKTFNFTVKQIVEDAGVEKEGKTVTEGSVEIQNGETTAFNFKNPIAYTLQDLLKADGTGYQETTTFKYSISEVMPTGQGVVKNADGSYTQDGYTYWPGTYTITVKVKDDGNGNLTPEIENGTAYADNTFAFTNSYKAAGESEIQAVKLLDSKMLTEPSVEFSFTLTEGSVAEKEGKQVFTVATWADALKEAQKTDGTKQGNIDFTKITYEKPGTYWYEIKEEPNAAYTQGGESYYVKDVVKDNYHGNLVVTQTIYKGEKDGEVGAELPVSSTMQKPMIFNNYTTTTHKVTKLWARDTEAVRPEEIYVILKRSTVNEADADWKEVDVTRDGKVDGKDLAKLTANATDSSLDWSYQWDRLQRCYNNDETKPYYYKAFEVRVDEKDSSGNVIRYTELKETDLVPAKTGDGQYSISNGTTDPTTNSQTITNTLGGDLSFTKKVVNPVDDDKKFKLQLQVTLPKYEGKEDRLTGEYQVVRTSKDGSETAETTMDARSGYGLGEYELLAGETITVKNLPIGTEYTLKELSIPSGYQPSYVATTGGTTSDSTDTEGKVNGIKGTLDATYGKVELEVTNTYTATGHLDLKSIKYLDDGHSTIPADNPFTYVLKLQKASPVNASPATAEKRVDASTETDGKHSSTVEFKHDDTTDATLKSMLNWTFDDDSPDYLTGVDYWFTLEEKDTSNGTTAPYEYDDTVYYIKAHVQDVEHNGKLTVTPTYYKGGTEEGNKLGESDLMTFSNYRTLDVSVEKDWKDSNADYKTRPDSVLVALMTKKTIKKADGTTTNGNFEIVNPPQGQAVVTLSETANSWKHTWPGLRRAEKTAEGMTLYDYKVVEVTETTKDGKTTYSVVQADGTVDGVNNGIYQVEYSKAPSSNAAKGIDDTKVTNTLVVTDLIIKKIVISDTKKDDKFTFKVNLFEFNGTTPLKGTYSYKHYNADNSEKALAAGETRTIEDGGTITLESGEWVEIQNLPVGAKYKVAETDAVNKTDARKQILDDYFTEYEVGKSNPTMESGKAMKVVETLRKSDNQVAFKNYYLEDLSIRKNQIGGKVGTEFDVLVEVDSHGDKNYEAFSGDYTITPVAGGAVSKEGNTNDGHITFTDGETIQIRIPHGTNYKVTETQKEGYETPKYKLITDPTQTSVAESSNPAEGQTKGTVEIINRYQTGKVTISKMAVGGYDDAEFTFKVSGLFADGDKKESYDVKYCKKDGTELTDAETAGRNKQLTKASAADADKVTLKSGEKAVIEGIDIGKVVTVEEISAKVEMGDEDYDVHLGEEYLTSSKVTVGTQTSEKKTGLVADEVTIATPSDADPDAAPKDYEIAYRNVHKTGTITVRKTNGTDNGHKGETITKDEAKFLMLREESDGHYSYMKQYVTSSSKPVIEWEPTETTDRVSAIEVAKRATPGNAEGKPEAVQLSTTKGELKLENMELGKYVFVEVVAPKGYILTDQPLEAALEENAQHDLTVTGSVENQEIPGTVTLKKIDAVTGSHLDGVEFTLYRTDLGGSADPKAETEILRFKTGQTYDGVEADKLYKRLYDAAIASDCKDEPEKAEARANAQVDLYRKVTITRNEDTTDTANYGTITIANLPWGTYRLKETAPGGYVQPEETAGSAYETFTAEFTINTADSKSLVTKELTNEKKTGTLTIGKEVTDTAGEKGMEEEFIFQIRLFNAAGEDYLAEGQQYEIEVTERKTKGGLIATFTAWLTGLFDRSSAPKKTAVAEEKDGKWQSVTEIRLKAGDKAQIKDLPYGTGYEIAEIGVEGKDGTYLDYNYNVTLPNAKGVIGYTGDGSTDGTGIKTGEVSSEAEDIYAAATISNARRVGKIKVRKVDAESGNPIGDAEFSVYHDLACASPAKALKDGKEVPVVIKTDKEKDGWAETPDLYLGTYYVKETKAPDGYLPRTAVYKAELTKDAPVVTLDRSLIVDGTKGKADEAADGTETAKKMKDVVTNIRTYGQVQLTKFGSDDTVRLQGVVFDLYKRGKAADGSEDVRIASGITTGEDGTWFSAEEDKLMNEETRELLSKGLWEGEYYFKETRTKDDYVVATSATADFVIKTENQYEVSSPATATAVKTNMKNTPLETSLKLVKRDAENGNALVGTTFTLYRRNSAGEYEQYGEPVITGKKGDVATWANAEKQVQKYTLKEDGELYIGGLKKGDYILKETTALPGYAAQTSGKPLEIPFTIRDEDHEKMLVISDSVLDETKDKEYLSNDRIPGTLILEKLDGETYKKLNGAKFALYREDEAKGLWEKLKEFFTGKSYSLVGTMDPADAEDGVLTVDGLAWGTYKIVETAAAGGYILEEGKNEFTFFIGLDEEGVFHRYCHLTLDKNMAIVNSRNKLLIHKTDESGTPLAGVVFVIEGRFAPEAQTAEGFSWGVNGNGVETLQFTTDGQQKALHGLLIGGETYTLTEVTAPNGYNAISGPVRFTMNTDGTAVLVTEMEGVTLDGDKNLITAVNKKRPPEDDDDDDDDPYTPHTSNTPNTPGTPTIPVFPGPGIPENTPDIPRHPIPKTGDDSPLLAWFLLLAGSAAGLAGLAVMKGKRKKEEDE